MNTTDMNTFDANTTRAPRRLVIATVSALALSVATISTLATATNATGGGGIFARLGDYITEVGEALGNE